jgi:histidinol-phosphatase
MDYTTNWLSLLQDLTHIADDIAMHYFRNLHYSGKTISIETKQDKTPVTQADIEIEEKIRAILASRHPDIVVFGEEFGEGQADAPLKLIIDPIDGTKNFIAGLPFFGSLMAIEQNGKLQAAVVSMPKTKEKWWASAKQGSFYSENPQQKLAVSSVASIEESMAFHSSFSGEKAHASPPSLIPLLNRTQRQRGYGDFFAHMMVAMGCGEFAFDCNLKIWDIAPLKLIVEEAGGTVTDLHGTQRMDTGTILSSNGLFHQPLVDALSKPV